MTKKKEGSSQQKKRTTRTEDVITREVTINLNKRTHGM
jgi:hypothetical protein